MVSIKSFTMPPIVFGSGAADRVGDEVQKLGFKKGLLVTDKVMVKLPGFETISQALERSHIPIALYDGVSNEPTLEIVQDGLNICRDKSCDFVIAIGGGSPIDTAKAISIMSTNPGSIEQYKGAGKVTYAGIPLVAVPTTAGTGSEVTPYTIITNTQTSVKMFISSPFVMPRLAIVDPLLSVSCPPGLTASIGLDALTHAIEAYVSLKASPLTDIYCLSAIDLLNGYLRQAWVNGNNIEAREKVMLGALEAGIAFSNSSVALVHGMSRPIGACFHVAHGASNAALLRTVMEFSLIGNPARYARIARALGENTGGKTDLEAARMALDAVARLTRDIKIASLEELGVDHSKLKQLSPKMAEDAIASGSPANNPRQVNQQEIIELYDKAYSNP
jgi:alcohol dehydrogenase class IV